VEGLLVLCISGFLLYFPLLFWHNNRLWYDFLGNLLLKNWCCLCHCSSNRGSFWNIEVVIQNGDFVEHVGRCLYQFILSILGVEWRCLQQTVHATQWSVWSRCLLRANLIVEVESSWAVFVFVLFGCWLRCFEAIKLTCWEPLGYQRLASIYLSSLHSLRGDRKLQSNY